MTQKRPSVQVTHSANVGLIGLVLFPLGAAFLPAFPRGDGVVLASLRPHLLRPCKVLRRGDDPLDGLGDGFDEERRNAHLPLPLAGLVSGPRPPRNHPSGNRRPHLGHQLNWRRAVHDHAFGVALYLHLLSFHWFAGNPRSRSCSSQSSVSILRTFWRENPSGSSPFIAARMILGDSVASRIV